MQLIKLYSVYPFKLKSNLKSGMKALSSGDSNGAPMHLEAAEMKLLKFASKFFVVVKE
jgi:hypothetical protein